MSTAAETGRRERKKAQTREALRAAAKELFARQGFAQTSVQQITDAVDVSERTFFRYFDSKEDLLLADLVALFDALTAALRGRPLHEPPLTAVRQAVLVIAGDPALSGAVIGLVRGMDPTSPGVAARLKAFIAWENRLADVLAERFAAADPRLTPADVRLHAEVIARVAVSAGRAVVTTARARARRQEQDPGLEFGRGGVLGELPAMFVEAFSIIASGCPAPSSSPARDV